MITDKKLLFGPAEDIPNAGNVDFDEIIDSVVAVGPIGEGTPVYWWAIVTEDGADGASAQIKLLDSDDNSTFEERDVSEDIPLARLKKGLVMICVPIPVEHQRYLKVNLIGTGAFSAGKVLTGLSLSPIRSSIVDPFG